MDIVTTGRDQRFSRQTAVPSIGLAGQQALARASVLVVGAGGLGHPVLAYLAAAGVGRLVVADDDTVSADNLARQILFQEADFGARKADVLKTRLEQNNSAISVESLPVRVTAELVDGLVRGHDVVVDASDNFGTRYLLSDACLRAGKPHVWGAVYRYEGFVATFPPDPARNYRALYPEMPPSHLSPTCASGGVVGPVCGMVGSLMAAECLKLLTTGSTELAGQVISVDLESLRLSVEPVVADRPTQTSSVDDDETSSDATQNVDGAQLRALLQSTDDLRLIDVRETWERANGSIQPSEHVPLGTMWRWIRDDDKTELLTVFYCESGGRSQQAIEIAAAVRGSKAKLVNLAGGMSTWRAALDGEGELR